MIHEQEQLEPEEIDLSINNEEGLTKCVNARVVATSPEE